MPPLRESARLANLRGKPDEAVRLMMRAADLSTGANDLDAALEHFDMHLRAGRQDAAREALGRLEAKAAGDAMVLMARARLALSARQVEPACAALAKASVQAGGNADTLTQVALLQMGTGDAKGAAATLARALQDSPDHLPAMALMVDADLRLRNLDAADKRARDIAARHPKPAVGPALMGDVAAARGRAGPALELWRKAHQLEPSSASTLRLHRVLVARDPAAALQVVNAWLKAQPRDPAVLRVQAETCMLAGQLPQARQAFEKLLEASPGNPELLNDFAHVLLAVNDTAGAGRAAAAALAARPETPHLIGTAGWVAFKSGQTDRALQRLRHARLRNPCQPRPALLPGRHGEAREELKFALAEGGYFANAKQARALLQTLR